MSEQQAPQQNVNINRPVDAEFAKWLEQLSEELLYLEHDLRGEYLDQTGERPEWIRSGEEVMNERGIRYIIGELRALANKNTFMSNLERDTDRVYDILVSYLNTITDNLLLNHVEYSLNSRHFDSVVEKCANIMEFALRRPLYAGERGFMKDSQTIHRIEDSRQPGIIGKAVGIFSGRRGH